MASEIERKYLIIDLGIKIEHPCQVVLESYIAYQLIRNAVVRGTNLK